MMGKPKNILFIMVDQLRADYLSCYGHKTLDTPNIDALAASGVRFDRAYCQSTVCGPSRMSFYTGRYVLSHGATWNDTPLSMDEMGIGDHLASLGYKTSLVGKTHMKADFDGMRRVGVDPESTTGQRIAECGFDAFLREEGIYLTTGDQLRHADAPYNKWLNKHGYEGDNPWHDAANSVDANGEVMSGWYLDAAPYPARVKAEHSETAYLTQKAIDCIDAQADYPWCIHVSYIKPHWPYIAPAPYNSLYDEFDIQTPQRDNHELKDTHPVFSAFQELRVSQAFADNDVRKKVIPTYMGLVKQLDDEIGILMNALRERDLLKETLIVFTSDHGDYLGDHWLGEKDFAHEPSVRIPLIISGESVIPSDVKGRVCDALVESIDLVPTFVELAGGCPEHPRLDGRSLLPWLQGKTPSLWRDFAFCEYDYSTLRVRRLLNQQVSRANFVVAVSRQYKLIYFPDFQPMLFDLKADPEELNDLGVDPEYAAVRESMHAAVLDWATRPRRVTESEASIDRRTDTQLQRGIFLGLRNEAEHSLSLNAEITERERRTAEANP